ncbi:magnesium transporter [Candidatus Caldatribacterium sp.]|uniref:magnesium transporter n=1 Tax=Candidatus Caldatribacterium sp. TaxID=2282143 RepID=UPI002996AA98|nr:magnesium transporter [Candidatus Caldatribacterium sp.]MDW8081652.1 magnesium transporter [Candidatus Calescibacterium sp.]
MDIEVVREDIAPFAERIVGLLEEGRYNEVKQEVNVLHPADIAELMGLVDSQKQVMLFRLLKKDLAIAVFEQLDFEHQENLLRHFTDEKVAEILNQMSPDDRMELFDELPAKVVKKLLNLLEPAQRDIAASMLGYPENSAGRIMNPRVVDLKEYYTVEQALKRFRRLNPPEELSYTAYVTDAQRRLLGQVSLRDLVLADPESQIGEIMNREVIFVSTDDDQEKVAQIIQKYDLVAVPVVDREGRLVGAVTVDDAIDIIEAEATEDIHRLAAIRTTEDEYLRAPLWRKIKNRFIWLAVLLIMGTLTSFVMQGFSSIIQAVVALSFFVPMLIDTGGNVGSQSTTVVVRGLAVGELEGKTLWKVVLAETLIGGILGILLGVIGVIRVVFLRESPLIGLVVGCSIFVIVFVSNLIGVFLPVLFKKMRLDPAIAATPVITTIVDIIGVLIYFRIAQAFLRF